MCLTYSSDVKRWPNLTDGYEQEQIEQPQFHSELERDDSAAEA
jgi:hypothetical protein